MIKVNAAGFFKKVDEDVEVDEDGKIVRHNTSLTALTESLKKFSFPSELTKSAEVYNNFEEISKFIDDYELKQEQLEELIKLGEKVQETYEGFVQQLSCVVPSYVTQVTDVVKKYSKFSQYLLIYQKNIAEEHLNQGFKKLGDSTAQLMNGTQLITDTLMNTSTTLASFNQDFKDIMKKLNEISLQILKPQRQPDIRPPNIPNEITVVIPIWNHKHMITVIPLEDKLYVAADKNSSQCDEVFFKKVCKDRKSEILHYAKKNQLDKIREIFQQLNA